MPWPSGNRDTTQFPSLDVQLNLNVDFRDHLQAFLNLDGVGWNDFETQKTVGNWNADTRARTYRKMYERLGLLYKDSQDKIRLSAFGRRLKDIPELFSTLKQTELSKLREYAVEILSRYQFMNPADNEDVPADCDVQPYLCIWTAMTQLQNKIHYEELNRVLLHVMKMTDLDAAIARIGSARQALGTYKGKMELELRAHLGEPVHSDQPTARISPWYSLAGWGGLIIAQRQDDEGFRHLTPEAIPLIERVVANPPAFFKTDSLDEWFAYYFGRSMSAIENPIPDRLVDLKVVVQEIQDALAAANLTFDAAFTRLFITALATKRFAILTGLSGSGKTQLAKKLGDWFGRDRCKLIPVRPDWAGPEHLLGYDDTLAGPGIYFAPPVLQFIIRAKENPHYPHLLILDEMNLAHVERYFADILSGMESGDPVLPNVATADGERYTRVPSQDKLIPLPINLFIVGTVNVDETTYMFSPKVLDRANTFEFRVKESDLDAARQRPQRGAQGDDPLVRGFLAIAQTDAYTDAPKQAEFEAHLKTIHRLLAANDWEFGFRVYYEANRFAALLSAAGDDKLESALDAQVMQKILPRLHGNRRRLEATLCSLGTYCLTLTYDKFRSDQEQIKHYNGLDDERKKLKEEDRPIAALPIAYDKVTRMLRNLRANQFASFTE